MRLAPAPTAGMECWRALFDPAFMDRALLHVQEEFDGLAAGAPATLHGQLRRLLIAPLEAWMGSRQSARLALDVQAAQRLHDVCRQLADRFEGQHPPQPGEAADACRQLREAWQDFRAEAAAHHVYHDEPARSLAAKRAAKLPRKQFRHRDTGAELTVEHLQALRHAWTAAGGQMKAFHLSIEEDFGASESHQRRMLEPRARRES